MNKPQRIQLHRTKGWNLQDYSWHLNGLLAKKVARPGTYRNPFKVGCNPFEFSTALPTRCDSVEVAIECFRYYADTWMTITEGRWINPLRGVNLACFCKIYKPCHADYLLELACK